MAVVMNGSGMRVVGGRGTVQPTSMQVNGQDVFRFDPETGTLSLSASPEICQMFIDAYKITPETPAEVGMPDPLGQPVIIKGVKAIVSLPAGPDGTWLIRHSG